VTTTHDGVGGRLCLNFTTRGHRDRWAERKTGALKKWDRKECRGMLRPPGRYRTMHGPNWGIPKRFFGKKFFVHNRRKDRKNQKRGGFKGSEQFKCSPTKSLVEEQEACEMNRQRGNLGAESLKGCMWGPGEGWDQQGKRGTRNSATP